MEQEIFSRLVTILTAHFDRVPPASEITMESKLHEELNLDSLDTIDLIMMVETTFEVRLDMNNAKNTRTIRDLVDTLVKLKQQ